MATKLRKPPGKAADCFGKLRENTALKDHPAALAEIDALQEKVIAKAAKAYKGAEKQAVNDGDPDWKETAIKAANEAAAAEVAKYRTLVVGNVKALEVAAKQAPKAAPPLIGPKAPDGTALAVADGMWVLFKDKDGRIIGQRKIGESTQAKTVAENINEDIKSRQSGRNIRAEKAGEPRKNGPTSKALLEDPPEEVITAALSTRADYVAMRLKGREAEGSKPSTIAGIHFAHESFMKLAKQYGISPPDHIKAEWPAIFPKTKAAKPAEPAPTEAPEAKAEPEKPVELMTPSEADAYERQYDLQRKAEHDKIDRFTESDLDAVDSDLDKNPSGVILNYRGNSKVYYTILRSGKRVVTYSASESGAPGSGFYQVPKSLSRASREELLKWLNGRHEFLSSRGTFYPWDYEEGHEAHVHNAAVDHKPVSAESVDAYGIKLPEGYVRESDQYVYRPKEGPPPAGRSEGRAVATASPEPVPSGAPKAEVKPRKTYEEQVASSQFVDDMKAESRAAAEKQRKQAFIGSNSQNTKESTFLNDLLSGGWDKALDDVKNDRVSPQRASELANAAASERFIDAFTANRFALAEPAKEAKVEKPAPVAQSEQDYSVTGRVISRFTGDLVEAARAAVQKMKDRGYTPTVKFAIQQGVGNSMGEKMVSAIPSGANVLYAHVDNPTARLAFLGDGTVVQFDAVKSAAPEKPESGAVAASPEPVPSGAPAKNLAQTDTNPAVVNSPAPQLADREFTPGEILEMRSPYTGDVVSVNYRGPLGDKSVVVMEKGGQTSVPTAWLSRSREAQLEILKQEFDDAMRVVEDKDYLIEKGKPLPAEYVAADREADAILKKIQELEKPIKEAEAKAKAEKDAADAKARSEKRDERVASLPVFQKRNGWEIVKDFEQRYILRDPNTKEEVYAGTLARVREVADESPPTPVVKNENSAGRVKNRGRLLVFDKPIQTPVGKILSYQWQSQLIEEVDSRGEEVVRRISDWNLAEENADTGKAIVHHFLLERPDGTRSIVSLESAIGALKGEQEGKTLKSRIAAARRLVVRQAELAQAESDLAEYERIVAQVKKEPAPEGEFVQDGNRRYSWMVDGNRIATMVLGHDSMKERMRTLDEQIQSEPRFRETEWQAYRVRQLTSIPAYKLGGRIADLKQLIKRDQQKMGGSLTVATASQEPVKNENEGAVKPKKQVRQSDEPRPIEPDQTDAPETEYFPKTGITTDYGPEYAELEQQLDSMAKVKGKSMLEHVRRLRANGDTFAGNPKLKKIVDRMNAIEQEANEGFTWTPEDDPADKNGAEIAGATGGALLHPLTAPSAPVVSIKGQSEIIRDLAKALKLPIRFGRLTTPKYAGYFKKVQDLIGVKRANDLPSVAHEVGHKIDSLFDISSNPAIAAELDTLGDPSTPNSRSSWTPSKTNAYKMGEGVGEFVRYWLIEPATASRMAPATEAYWNAILDANPDFADQMRQAQSDIHLWRTAPAEARLDSSISTGSNPNKTHYRLNQLTRDLVDDLHILRVAFDDYEKLNGKVKPSENFYMLARLMRGSFGMAGTFVQKGTADFTTKNVTLGNSLEDALKPVAGRLNEFRRWIIAKRAQELRKRGKETGLVPADVDEIATKYDGDAVFEKAFEDVKAWQDSVLQYCVDSGYVTAEAADNMREMNRDYVPFHRVFEIGAGENSSQEGSGIGRGLNVGRAGSLKRLDGSLRDIVDPIETMIKNAYTLITAAEKSNVSAQISKLASKQGMGKWVEEVATPKEPVRVQVESIKKQLEDAGADVSAVPDDLALTFFQHSGRVPFGENIIKVTTNGQTKFYRLNSDLFDTFHSLNNENSSALTKLLAAPAQILRSGVTLDPAFTGANIFKDAFGSSVISKYGLFPFQAAYRGIVALLKDKKSVAEWAASGGEQSFEAIYFDQVKLADYIRQNIAKDKSKAVRATAWIHPKNWLLAMRYVSGMGEMVTRIGEYKTAYEHAVKNGMSEGDARRQAAFESRDRQDFSVGGAKTRGLRQTAPFWNVGIQGNLAILRAFKARPLRSTLQGLAFITLPTIALMAINHDDDDYWDRPQWERDLCWLIPYGKDANGRTKFMRMPKPFILGQIFGTTFERAGAHLKGRENPYKDFTSSIYSNVVPVPIPTFLAPLEALIGDRGFVFWKGEYLIPKKLEDVPPEFQVTEQTSLMARKLGKLFELSPMKIDHMISSVTGGVGKQVVHGGIDNIISAISGDKPTAQNVGIFSRFFAVPAGINSANVNDFYEKITELREAKRREDLGGRPMNPGDRGKLNSMELAAKQISHARDRAHKTPDMVARQKIYLEIVRKAKQALGRKTNPNTQWPTP